MMSMMSIMSQLSIGAPPLLAVRPRHATADAAFDTRTITTLRGAAAAFFGRWSPRLLAAQWLTVVALRLAAADYTWGDLAIVAAIAVIWPMQEWFLHQYALHRKPGPIFGVMVDPKVARIHRAHHRRPWDLRSIFLPGPLIAVMIPFHVAIWWAVTPTPALALTGMAAYGGAALLYEWIHFLTHTHVRPRSARYRRIWRAHRLHHFKNERYWHGFTSPLVDVVMGTAPAPSEVETSLTCATLGVDEEG